MIKEGIVSSRELKKNLFIVASPLQLINAIEARYHFKTSDNILVLMYNSLLNNTDFNQKKSLLVEEDWDEVIYYDLGKIAKKKRFFEQVKLIKQFQRYKYSYLFSGDFGTIQQALMANLNIENIYLLDDGTASIVIYEKLKDKQFFKKIPFFKKLKLYRYLLMNLKFKIQENINFFTIYNLEPLAHMHVVQHNFAYLKQNQLKRCEKNDVIYILGQNISENAIINKEIYLKYLEKIKDKFKGKIIYKPHRSEEITDAYNYLISEHFLIDNDISQGPIETSFINNHIYPSIIISFFSSALFSLDKIFDESSIYAIKINDEDFIEKGDNVQVIKSLYNFFEGTGVKTIEVF